MSDSIRQAPHDAPPEAPRPFAPGPPPGAGGGGGRRPLVIGCAVLVVLLGLAAIGLFLKAKDLFGWVLERFETEITEQLPADLTEQEEARLSAAFAGAREAVADGRADPQALRRLQELLREIGLRSEPGGLSREEVASLTEALEAVAAGDDRAMPLPPDG